jgi:hypothetical protein
VADIAFLATIVAFFILCIGYVELCGRIIGPDEVVELEGVDADESADDEALERAA